MKKVFEAVKKPVKDVPAQVTSREISKGNDKVLPNKDIKLLDTWNQRGILASVFLLWPTTEITEPKQTSQFTLVKNPDSNKVNDLLINKTKPVTLYDNLLNFRATNEKFVLQGELLKMITSKNCKSRLANIPDEKLMFELAREIYFDYKALDRKSGRVKFFIRLLQSAAIMQDLSKRNISQN